MRDAESTVGSNADERGRHNSVQRLRQIDRTHLAGVSLPEGAKLLVLQESDLMPGMALPWPVYTQRGVLLLQPGTVISDIRLRDKLLKSRACRPAAANLANEDAGGASPGGERPEEPAVEPVDPLAPIRASVESVVLTYQFAGDFEPRRIPVEFIGQFHKHALLVTAPPPGIRSWRDHEGLEVSVKLLSGRWLYAFATTVTDYLPRPRPHLALRYPTSVDVSEFRRSQRFATRTRAMITGADGNAYPCIISDISGTGCGLDCEFATGQPGDSVSVLFNLSGLEESLTLSVPAFIKTVRSGRAGCHHGLEFDVVALEADWQKAVMLKSLIFDVMRADGARVASPRQAAKPALPAYKPLARGSRASTS